MKRKTKTNQTKFENKRKENSNSKWIKNSPWTRVIVGYYSTISVKRFLLTSRVEVSSIYFSRSARSNSIQKQIKIHTKETENVSAKITTTKIIQIIRTIKEVGFQWWNKKQKKSLSNILKFVWSNMSAC